MEKWAVSRRPLMKTYLDAEVPVMGQTGCFKSPLDVDSAKVSAGSLPGPLGGGGYGCTWVHRELDNS
jgi:hypothetical protein